jgi:hypothetical protein
MAFWVGYNVIQFEVSLTIQRNIQTLSSGLKTKSILPANSIDFMLGLFFTPEDRDTIFL